MCNIRCPLRFSCGLGGSNLEDTVLLFIYETNSDKLFWFWEMIPSAIRGKKDTFRGN